MENNTLGNIYCLKNPTTNEIFYVGALPNSNPYNRTWVLFSSLDKELQDIVRNLYESRDY